MRLTQTGGADERIVRRYEYEDEWVVAAELGGAADAGDIDVDVVGETAIVIVDGETEAELDLPGEAVAVGAENGVLTIRGGA